MQQITFEKPKVVKQPIFLSDLEEQDYYNGTVIAKLNNWQGCLVLCAIGVTRANKLQYRWIGFGADFRCWDGVNFSDKKSAIIHLRDNKSEYAIDFYWVERDEIPDLLEKQFSS